MKTLKKIALIFVALFALALFTGCSVEGASQADPKASSAALTKPTSKPSADPMVHKFNETMTYTDGVSVSISAPIAFVPSPEAAGEVTEGQKPVQITVVVTNNSKKTLSLTAFPTATSGGEAANTIVDIGQHVGMVPDAPILVGQTLKWVEAFSVTDPTNMTVSLAPSFAYQNAIFTSK